jgi:hypothetical protein
MKNEVMVSSSVPMPVIRGIIFSAAVILTISNLTRVLVYISVDPKNQSIWFHLDRIDPLVHGILLTVLLRTKRIKISGFGGLLVFGLPQTNCVLLGHNAHLFPVRDRKMAIGEGQSSYAWNFNSILNNAPPNSGVYAILNTAVCIYAGEGGDIQACLLHHFTGDTRIIRNAPTRFQFELIPAAQRVARQNQLIAALNSVCNQKTPETVLRM